MNVTFYFDPSCPYSWITSRWLLLVSGQRDISITWKPFSLALKNNELHLAGGGNKNTAPHQASHRALRIMMAATQQHKVKMIDLYSASGMIYHILGDPLDNTGLAAMLKNLQLPAELLLAADDSSFDDTLQHYVDEAVNIVGKDIGVPTLVFNLPDGNKQGYFGPVLGELPQTEESLKIWDGLSKLATTQSFFELKRSRKGKKADVASTARC